MMIKKEEICNVDSCFNQHCCFSVYAPCRLRFPGGNHLTHHDSQPGARGYHGRDHRADEGRRGDRYGRCNYGCHDSRYHRGYHGSYKSGDRRRHHSRGWLNRH